jgi:hypothetical protein
VKRSVSQMSYAPEGATGIKKIWMKNRQERDNLFEY